MQRLFVLYDDRCGICRWARRWVEDQPAFVEVVFVAARSEAARNMLPTLAPADPPEELVAVSDAGEVYRGGSAWVMVLYCLEDYREWSLRLGTPAMLPLARQAFAWFSKNRGGFSRWLGLDDDELRSTLGRIESPACETEFGVRERPMFGRPLPKGGRGAGWDRQFGG